MVATIMQFACGVACLTAVRSARAESASADKVEEPFAFGDFTWLNGNNRQHKALLDTPYFTGSVLIDANYTLSTNRPKDNTVVGSTSVVRENELTLSNISFGGDLHWGHARGRVMTQFGTRSTVLPSLDASANRGQYDLQSAMRYLSEAYAGYHADVWHGLNIDVGMFMSYVGLLSYNNAENWSYQPSFTSDNTPWYFNGLRVQAFPTDKLKLELWVINGWQSYGKFNEQPGLGFQLMWRPEERLSMVTSAYFGADTRGHPGRVRVHSDSHVQLRYFQKPDAPIGRGAFSVTADMGFESGGGVSAFGDAGPAQNFLSGTVAHRLWFARDQFAWSLSTGFMHNPGRYLVLLPPGQAGATFDVSPGSRFDAWDASTTFDWMPDELQTWRLEFVHRRANVPYFAGPGGVTSADGYNTSAPDPAWKPDLVKSETRLIAALLLRF